MSFWLPCALLSLLSQLLCLCDCNCVLLWLCVCRRWLEYEEAHGTAGDVEGVKLRAMDYMRAQEAA